MTISFPRGLDTAMGSSNGGTVGSGVQNVLNNLASFVRNIPTECHRHVIVITFILRNKHHTNIQIEIQELEGGVKATGLLCLLGIGIGLGSLFIYKLYTRLFPKILLPPPAQTSSKIRRPNSGDLCCQNLVPPANNTASAGDKALAETPDSGISTDTAGTDNQPLPASIPGTYPSDTRQTDTQFQRRRNTVAEWLARAELASSDLASEADYTSDIYGNLKDAFKSLRSWRSSGYVSVDQTTGAVSCEGDGPGQRKRILNEQDPTCFRLDEDALSDGVLSITDHILVPSLVSEDPADDLDNIATDDLMLGSDEHTFPAVGKASSLPNRRRKLSSGSNLSADVPRIWLRRNHHSFGSDLSAASSGYTYRESLVSKGFSVDLGEDLSGIMTPPDGDTGTLDHWTMSSMDQLHKELRKIQEDISYMNDRVEGLISKEDSVQQTQDLFSDDEEENRRIMVEARSRRRGRSRSLSSVRSRSGSVGAEIEDDLDAPDFIWDYHSDLALDQHDKPMFVVKRPCPVFSDDILDLPEPSLNLGATTAMKSEKRCSSKRSLSTGLNQNRPGGFGEAYFDDEVCLGERGFESPSLLCGAVHVTSKCNQEHVHSSSAVEEDADLPVFSHLNHHICDCQSCMPGVCFPSGICGYTQPPCLSDICSCCREKMFFRRPHHSCSSCHVHRKGRPSSARISRRYDRPLSSGGCQGCSSQSKGCEFCQPCPAVHHCGNHPVLRCKSHDVPENKRWRRQLPNLADCHGPCVPPAPKPCFIDTMNTGNPKAINIGNKVNIRDYLAQELGHHGCDRNADLRKGFDLLNRLWGIASIRKIRNDQYSNLRAVLYQALVHNLPILAATGNFEHLVQKLAMAIDSGHSYLIDWNFGHQSVLTKEETVMKMTECLRILFEQVEAVAGMSNIICREQYLLALLNHSPEMDHSLLEGLKILMVLKAIELFSERAGHKDVPSFVLQLFAKESSKSLESFFTSHINVIGNTRPMRAVEISLLGLTLGVRIEVIRPSLFNKEGFIVHYPDEGADGFGKLHIIQEGQDFNQYSIPVMKYTL